MDIPKMTYSYSAVMECISLVKKQTWTVSRKNQHFAKSLELQKVFDFCYEKTRCLLFSDGWNDLDIYRKHSYDYKNFTKKELDKELQALKRFLQGELTSIYNLMQNGEVNVIL